MAKTAHINLRIDPATKQQAEDLFADFGISVTDAITVFLKTAIMEGGIPFQIKQPRYNQETERAIAEARALMDGTQPLQQYTSPAALFAAIDKES